MAILVQQQFFRVNIWDADVQHSNSGQMLQDFFSERQDRILLTPYEETLSQFGKLGQSVGRGCSFSN